MKKYVTAIILAAGSGSRMNMNTTKQKLLLAGESVLHRAVGVFEKCEDITSIIVVSREEEIEFARAELEGFEKVKAIVAGGATRLESAFCGFRQADGKTEFVAIHDAARCFVTERMISDVLRDAITHGAATASAEVTDTIKIIDFNGNIEKNLSRSTLRAVQTPQIFRMDLYAKAIQYTDLSDASITDDNMLLERIGVHPYCTDTGKENFKITTVEDLRFAKYLLKEEE